jgi:hypothetical protein
MSQLDSEIMMLRRRLADLEEQKQMEVKKASEKKELPLKTLEVLIDHYESLIPGKNHIQEEKWRKSREKLIFLKPIIDVLKEFQERLEILEMR